MNIPNWISGPWRKIRGVEPPSTDRVFKGVWRGREWRIDDTGIHEFRDNQPYTTVMWADLERFDGQKLRGTHGAGSRVLLPADRLARFRAALYAEWERRFPGRFRANQAWALRRFAVFVFLWLPMIYTVLCVGPYLLMPGAARRGAPTAELHARANRQVWLSAATVGMFWALYGHRRWKHRRTRK